LNAHTPSISVVDPRGSAVRAVAYFRQAVGEPATARVTHHVFDPVGRLTQQRDPRLFALGQDDASVPANLTTIHSLTGQALCSDSVDAGWQLELPGAAGQVLESWDQRGWHRRTVHDSLLRPVAVHEQVLSEPGHCVERMTFGGVSDDHARHNRCGQLIRQDDPAGSRLIVDYGLSAALLHEWRYFLDTFGPVDWPDLEADRDSLLEPGAGAQSMWNFAPTGELVTQTDAKGHSQHFAHDRAGQLRSVGLQRSGKKSSDTLVSAIQYSATGQVENETASNGMRTTRAYDPADGRLLLLTTQGPNRSYLQKLSYGYDPVGNITEIADAALPIEHFANQRIEPVRRFVYDTLFQLISATGWEAAKPSLGPALPDWQVFGPADASRWCNYSETYHYDAAGNLLQRIHHGAVDDTLTMRVAPHSNRSVKTRSGQPAVEDLFDVRGNLLELQPGQALRWNGRNQLARVTLVARIDGSDDEERYVYDSEGTRVQKRRTTAARSINHTAEVRYLPGIELHTNSASGEQLQVVSVQAGRCTVRLLHWDNPPPAGLENDQLRFCFDDHLGSSAFEVDAQGKTISQEVFYPFGGTAWLAGRHEVETSYKTIRYSGKERDATGLYYYGARYYAPWLQRWLNPDPAGDVDGLNLYRFVRNSSINFIDEFGLYPFETIINWYWNWTSSIVDYLQYRLQGKFYFQGMYSIRSNFPEVGKSLDEAIVAAKITLENTVASLEGGFVKEDVVEHHFGKLSPEQFEYLKKGYRELLSDAGNLITRPDRVDLYNSPNGKEGMRVVNGSNIIGVNIARFFEVSSSGMLSHAVIHELTHMSDVFYSADTWYLNSPREDVIEWTPVYSSGNASFLESAFERKHESLFVKSGANNMAGAIQVFTESQDFRTQLALNNADTLTNFARHVSKVHNERNNLSVVLAH
jgi:insecticidal toxin complex protein TccC